MTPIFVFTGIVKSTPVPLLMCVTTTPILFTSPTVSTVTGFFAFHMIPNSAKTGASASEAATAETYSYHFFGKESKIKIDTQESTQKKKKRKKKDRL